MQNGNTPLHGAAWYGHTDIVKMLLDNGAETNHVNEVSRGRWIEMYMILTLWMCVQHGNTPLDSAKGRSDIVDILQEKGAVSKDTTKVGRMRSIYEIYVRLTYRVSRRRLHLSDMQTMRNV